LNATNVYTGWFYIGNGVWSRIADAVRIVRTITPTVFAGPRTEFWIGQPGRALIGPFVTFGDAARGC
jgi:hypothetical protein